ncbi:MAG: hypothetical protein ISQ02_08505 [Pseudomonadales bacterium]|nr:hypothetical protein [Pseudomonadales bacterium]
MKSVALALLSFFISGLALADQSALNLVPRQAPATMTVTSVVIGAEQTHISAEGTMGAYGKVYVTYHLHRDGSATQGSVSGAGRGFIDVDTMASGTFRGAWRREGARIYMTNVVNLSDGSQNLDIIEFDGRDNTISVRAYVLH